MIVAVVLIIKRNTVGKWAEILIVKSISSTIEVWPMVQNLVWPMVIIGYDSK